MTKHSISKDDMHLIRATLSNIENVDEDPYYILIHADTHKNQEERMSQIINGLKALEILGKIEIYVRLLQDGDPENEKPEEILDYIEKEIQPMLNVIYNE